MYYNALGPKEDDFEKYQTMNFLERNVEGIQSEEVDAYNLTLGKLFKWVTLALKTRKEDIVRRKALNLRAQDQRTQIQDAIQAREVKRGQDVQEAEDKFKEEHKDEIEAALRYEQMELERQEDEYGEEEEEEENPKEKMPKEKPVMPVFNHDDFLEKWIEDNPEPQLPDEIVSDIDNDWVLTEEEEEALINGYFQAKQEQ